MPKVSSRLAAEAANDLIFSFEQANPDVRKIKPVKVKVEYSPNTWAGLCLLGQDKLIINAFIMEPLAEPFFLEILAHEVSHHIVDRLSVSASYPHHGKLWKQVGKEIGAFPFQGHLYPLYDVVALHKDQFFGYVNGNSVQWLTLEEHQNAKGRIKAKESDWIFDDDFSKTLEIQKTIDHNRKDELLKRVEAQPWKQKTFWKHYGKDKYGSIRQMIK